MLTWAEGMLWSHDSKFITEINKLNLLMQDYTIYVAVFSKTVIAEVIFAVFQTYKEQQLQVLLKPSHVRFSLTYLKN